jgi:hypothetical protein
MIAAHRVEGYGHHVFARTLGFDDFDHFTALVDAAVWARAMSANFHMAIRAFGELRHFQRIMRPAG